MCALYMQPKDPKETCSHDWECDFGPILNVFVFFFHGHVGSFALHLFLKAFNKIPILHIIYMVAYNYSALNKYSTSLKSSTF